MGEFIRNRIRVIIVAAIISIVITFLELWHIPRNIEYPILVLSGIPISLLSNFLLIFLIGLAIEQRANIRISIILFIGSLFIGIIEGSTSFNLLAMGAIPFIILMNLTNLITSGEYALLSYIILFFLIQLLIGGLLFFMTIKHIEKPKNAFMIAIGILILVIVSNFIFFSTNFGQEKLLIFGL